MLPAPPHDASGHTWHHDDETLFQISKWGVAKVIGDNTYKTAMPVYADILSDAQIIAVLSWIKAQWPPEVRKNNDLVNTERR
jgi:mono/diheme cytochrome c family protein